MQSLPDQQINHLIKDYFDEAILEPLSVKPVEGGQGVKTPTKSPKRGSSGGGVGTPGKIDYDAGSESPSKDPFYCNYCKKRFQSDSTWTQHVNTSKHKQQVKEAAQKMTTSPGPKGSPQAKSGSVAASVAISTMREEQEEVVKQALKVRANKPNLACKNLFQAARAYEQGHWIRESATCLQHILDIQHEQQAGKMAVEADYKNLCAAGLSLTSKTHMYFARLTRHFDKPLAEHHYLQCFLGLNIVTLEQLDDLVSQARARGQLLTVLNKIHEIVRAIPVPEAPRETVGAPTAAGGQETPAQAPLQPISVLSSIEEVAGGLCYQTANPKSLVLYFILLAVQLCAKTDHGEQIGRTYQRIIKLLKATGGCEYWVIEFYLRSFQVGRGLDQLSQALRHAMLYSDLVRLRALLDYADAAAGLVASAKAATSNRLVVDKYTMLCELSAAYLRLDVGAIGQIKDEYEYLIVQSKELHDLIQYLSEAKLQWK